MSSISSLSAAVSALMSSQTALHTTAHNLSNVNTVGYVRQQVLLQDSRYLNKGQNATTGFYVGLGVDVQAIRQVRDFFLDQSFRQENARDGFYTAHADAIEEVETILGETEGESFANVLGELWNSLNTLSNDPGSLETRAAFVKNAGLFISRSNLISNQLDSYQSNMNAEVIDMVTEINSLGKQISALNTVIVKQELSGGNANDYRDHRNNLLDQLSTLVDITYKEDMKGNVSVQIEGTEFINLNSYNEMSIETEDLSLMVKPVWNHLRNTNNEVFDLTETISTDNDNDKGKLKGLLLARGNKITNYTDLQNQTSYENNIKPSIIMNVKAQFDNLIHGIVTMINDRLSPNVPGPPPTLDTANAPYGLDGTQGIELFSRKGVARYDASNNYIEEDPDNPYTLYSAGNLVINQEILSDYDKICLSKTMGDVSDNSVTHEMLNKWSEASLLIEPGLTNKLSYNEYYTEFISEVGNRGISVNAMKSHQELMVMQIENQRSSLTAVSSEEELSNMIKFQHAYNAAAKVVTVLDQMIEQIVMSTGLVGR